MLGRSERDDAHAALAQRTDERDNVQTALAQRTNERDDAIAALVEGVRERDEAMGALDRAGGEASNKFSVPGVESQKALDVLKERFPSQSGTSAQVVFAVESGSLTDATAAATVDAALADIAAQPNVAGVSELNLSVRARKCMNRLALNNLGELCQRTADELLEAKNFGMTSLNEVREKLSTYGLTLRGD